MNATLGAKQEAPSGSPNPPHPWIWVAALTAAGACLRLIGMNRGLWWDEIYFLIISVRHPMAEIVTIFPADTQHPLYSILAKLAVLAFGEHPWTLRLPAVLFGIASIPALYVLATSVTSRLEALLAAALLTISYHHVWFSQNARGYTMLAFWTLIATYFLLGGIRTGRRAPYLAYGVVVGLGVYTHLTMMFLVASHLLIVTAIVLDGWRKGEGFKKWQYPLQGFTVAGVITVLLYAPILTQVRNFFMHHASPMRAVSTPRWALWETFRGLTLGFGTTAVLLGAAVLVAFGAWSYFRQNRLAFSLFALPGVITAVGAVLTRGTMYPRFYFSLIGFAILILIRGVIALPEWLGARMRSPRLGTVLAAAMAAGLLAASGISLLRNYRFPKQDFEGALAFVESHRAEGETVVTAGATTYPMRNYYGKSWEGIESAGNLEALCRPGQVVWLMYTFPRYLEAAVPGITDVIQREFKLVQVFPGTLGDGDVYVTRFQP
jgi:mannosyltransferase